MKKIVGNRLKSLLKDRDYNQLELHKELYDPSGGKIVQASISRWVNHKASPCWTSLCWLSDHFKVPLEYFRRGTIDGWQPGLSKEWDGSILRTICNIRDVSALMLASYTGLHEVAIHDLFKNLSTPKVDTACRIADALDIKLDDLRGKEKE